MSAALPLVLLRHGPTLWNAAGRIQGRSDQPLSAEGRALVAAWTVPKAWQSYRWVTSPLTRARETAALLGHGEAAIAEALIEADWGDWEGERLDALRQRLGAAMQAAEDRGLDFCPPGGESPRRLQQRLQPWLRALSAENQPTVAVCHKGIIRALYALASGWDMTGRPPEKLRLQCAQCLALDAQGALSIARLNLPLTAGATA